MYFLKLFLAVIFIVACNATDLKRNNFVDLTRKGYPNVMQYNPRGIVIDTIKQRKALELLNAHYNWTNRNLLLALANLSKNINTVAEVIKVALNQNPAIRNILGKRYKRDVKKEVKKEATSTAATITVNETNENEIANNCDASGSKSKVNCSAEINGRRSMGGIDTAFIKEKLLFYVEESVREIQAKVNSLVRVKGAFSKVVPFRMGYIVANIDTLAVNMRNLRQTMEANKNVWDERQILNVYDRLKISNAIVSHLLAVLRAYIGRV